MGKGWVIVMLRALSALAPKLDRSKRKKKQSELQEVNTHANTERRKVDCIVDCGEIFSNIYVSENSTVIQAKLTI